MVRHDLRIHVCLLTVDFAVVAAAVKENSDVIPVVNVVVVNLEVVAPLGGDDACVREIVHT